MGAVIWQSKFSNHPHARHPRSSSLYRHGYSRCCASVGIRMKYDFFRLLKFQSENSVTLFLLYRSKIRCIDSVRGIDLLFLSNMFYLFLRNRKNSRFIRSWGKINFANDEFRIFEIGTERKLQREISRLI